MSIWCRGRLVMEALEVPRQGGMDMSQRKIGRAFSAGLLAAALLLAGSAPADAAGRGPASLWRWIIGGWMEWAGGVLAPGRSAPPAGSRSGSWVKAGPGIDPNGGTPPPPASPTGTSCQDCGDPGAGTGSGGSL